MGEAPGGGRLGPLIRAPASLLITGEQRPRTGLTGTFWAFEECHTHLVTNFSFDSNCQQVFVTTNYRGSEILSSHGSRISIILVS